MIRMVFVLLQLFMLLLGKFYVLNIVITAKLTFENVVTFD